MARPAKIKVDYFPHVTHSGKTIAILEARWGNDGYAFWFKLLEMLGDSNDFSFNCNHSADWEYLLSKTRVTEPVAVAILDKLAEIEAIDDACWQQKIVWSDNFVRNLEPVFEKRKRVAPQKPEFPEQKPGPEEVSGDFRSGNSTEPGIIPTETDKGEERKGKEIEGKERKEEKRKKPYAGAGSPANGNVAVATDLPGLSGETVPEGAPTRQRSRKPSRFPCPSKLRPGVVRQADTVFLSLEERERLGQEFGEDGAERLIALLDGYKTNNPDKGAKYVDDYKAIRSWVVPRYRKELHDLQPAPRAGPHPSARMLTFNDKLADMARGEIE